ncbi:hypothetical protein B0H14DRAFT_2765952 [Mycena olivaceomarginata]|nr:hypothetical protein B0H14DRAFT_2765952 [Mycena olivaceomarginata]
MPPLAVVEASNAAFSPSYIPVAVFVGGTSGVGQAMAEALARQTQGRAHIIIVGRNTTAAAEILAGFPKPKPTEAEDGWTHEFVACEAKSMASVRTVCAALSARLKRINFLVITAGGPQANSLTTSCLTSEGLNAKLAMRYFMRYLFTKELLPLLGAAQELGQHAHVMTVLGAGFGFPIRTTDLGLHEAHNRSIKFLQGLLPSAAAIKAHVTGFAYNDGLVAHFAAGYPAIAFTHILPGNVLTKGGSHIELGWLFAPLAWVLGYIKRAFSFTQDKCAQYMLYGLLDTEPARGVFIRGQLGDVVSSHVFTGHEVQFDATSPTANKTGVLHGIRMKGYGGSDASVAGLVAYTEKVLSAIP